MHDTVRSAGGRVLLALALPASFGSKVTSTPQEPSVPSGQVFVVVVKSPLAWMSVKVTAEGALAATMTCFDTLLPTRGAPKSRQ